MILFNLFGFREKKLITLIYICLTLLDTMFALVTRCKWSIQGWNSVTFTK